MSNVKEIAEAILAGEDIRSTLSEAQSFSIEGDPNAYYPSKDEISQIESGGKPLGLKVQMTKNGIIGKNGFNFKELTNNRIYGNGWLYKDNTMDVRCRTTSTWDKNNARKLTKANKDNKYPELYPSFKKLKWSSVEDILKNIEDCYKTLLVGIKQIEDMEL